MRTFAVIGLSSFGHYLCRYLSELGSDVMAIDISEERIDEVKGFVKKAVVADAKDKETLKQLGLEDVDVAVVSVGDRIDTSILITLFLRELGTKEIIAKAMTEDHAKILNLIGASEIIFPERDMAKRTAHTIRKTSLLDYVSLAEGVSVVEMAPPSAWNGKSLAELQIRREFNVQVIMIKELLPENVVLIPGPDHVIKESDVLVMIGRDEDLERLEKLQS